MFQMGAKLEGQSFESKKLKDSNKNFNKISKNEHQLVFTFEKRKGKAPFRLIKNLKFRAALNFLKLRANINMADSNLPIWWEKFSTQKEEERINLINSVSYTNPDLSQKKRNKSMGVHTT